MICRPAGRLDQCRKFLDEVGINIDEAETLLTRNRIWVGSHPAIWPSFEGRCDQLWLEGGPNLRGSGVDYDTRKNQPYLCYKDLDFDIPVGATGDCYDRYLVHMEEMRQSVRILRQCIEKNSRRRG